MERDVEDQVMSLLGWRTFLVGAGMIAVSADGTLYKYVDREAGTTVYSNIARRTRKPKDTASSDAATVTPAAVPGAAARTKAAVPTRAGPRGKASAGTDFPRIAPAMQRERDSERRKILNDELQSEQAALHGAIAKKADHDVIHRHEANISALQREIRSTK
jgi:hypothetical protein